MINIWVVCSESSEGFGKHSFELLSKAQSLIYDGITVSAICFGDHNKNMLQSLFHYGANEIIYAPTFNINCTLTTKILFDMLKKIECKPNLIIFPATEWGKNIAAELAVKIDGGLISECIDIEYKKINNNYQFVFTRAAISSTVLAKIICVNTNICMCTCKERAFTANQSICTNNFSICEWISETHETDLQGTLLYSEPAVSQNRNMLLENSKIVFGVGRGIKGKNDLELVKKVARKYNAVIAGSRGIVEDGLIEKENQIGQSGISVSPDIYVAIGISGASQHMVGVKNAKKIIAINSYQRAPIFSYADYCIIDDFRNVFRELV